MKRTLLLLLAAMLLSIVSAQGYAANRIDYSAKFDLPEELIKSNQKPDRLSAFTTLTLKDGGQYGEIGAPALPMKTFQFLVPVYTGKFTVTAKWPEKPAFSAAFNGSLKILPGATVDIISDGNIYFRKGYYYLGGQLTTYSRGSVVTLSKFTIQGGATIKKNIY